MLGNIRGGIYEGLLRYAACDDNNMATTITTIALSSVGGGGRWSVAGGVVLCPVAGGRCLVAGVRSAGGRWPVAGWRTAEKVESAKGQGHDWVHYNLRKLVGMILRMTN